MKRCLEEHGLALGDGKDGMFRSLMPRPSILPDLPVAHVAQVKRIHDQNRSHLWMQRPLATNLLNYAAKDVHLIHLIYDHFKGEGYIDSQLNLLAQSKRYVSIHADVMLKPLRNDCFRRSAVVPLDVLEEPRGILYDCRACHRYLSLPCFRCNRHSQRRMVCRVCHVARSDKRRGKDLEDGWVSY
jgi:exonuclease 3'-5' domain-containing protein 1